MVNQAKVNLYGRTVGYLALDQRYGIVRFEYDRDFIRTGIQPSPIMMPAVLGRVYAFGDLNKETFKGLPGMLADSLPDTYGRALFDKWLALTGRTSCNAIETLCFLGKRCMGALEFEPAIDMAYDPDMKIEIDTLVGVAREALSQKEDFNTNLSEDSKAAIAEILRLGTSAGGQRAKAIIAYIFMLIHTRSCTMVCGIGTKAKIYPVKHLGNGSKSSIFVLETAKMLFPVSSSNRLRMVWKSECQMTSLVHSEVTMDDLFK